MNKGIIAVDIGASSGRLILGKLEGRRLLLKEVHRFKNEMTLVRGHYTWCLDDLFDQIIIGLIKLKLEGIVEDDVSIESIGIDTWSVDYALIDGLGDSVGSFYAYRDHRTDATMDKVFSVLDPDVIYEKTGIQFLQFNSLYQLYEHTRTKPYDFLRATQWLMVPDYLNYRLSGVQAIEYTNATSTQLINLGTGEWDQDLLDLAGVPREIMSQPVEPGTVLGQLKEGYQTLTQLENLKVIAPATHDTGSAVVAVPAMGQDFAYISSGTWSLMGIESQQPITSGLAKKYNFTNEGGAYGTYRFLKNIMGLWLIQEVARLYKGMYSFAELVTLAEQAQPFRSLIHPNDARFLNPKHMIKTIEDYCDQTHQPVPKQAGQMARCIFESLALLYKEVLEELRAITGKEFKTIHVIGGGCQNKLLNQMCADMTGCEVLAGPIEATTIGNIAVQMITLGMVEDMQSARKIIADSFEIQSFAPRTIDDMDQVYKRFRQLGGL